MEDQEARFIRQYTLLIKMYSCQYQHLFQLHKMKTAYDCIYSLPTVCIINNNSVIISSYKQDAHI